MNILQVIICLILVFVLCIINFYLQLVMLYNYQNFFLVFVLCSSFRCSFSQPQRMLMSEGPCLNKFICQMQFIVELLCKQLKRVPANRVCTLSSKFKCSLKSIPRGLGPHYKVWIFIRITSA